MILIILYKHYGVVCLRMNLRVNTSISMWAEFCLRDTSKNIQSSARKFSMCLSEKLGNWPFLIYILFCLPSLLSSSFFLSLLPLIFLTFTCIRLWLFWRTFSIVSVPQHYPPVVKTSAKTFPSSRYFYSSESSSKNVQTLTHTSSCIWQQFLSSNNDFCPSLLPRNRFLPTTTTPP